MTDEFLAGIHMQQQQQANNGFYLIAKLPCLALFACCPLPAPSWL